MKFTIGQQAVRFVDMWHRIQHLRFLLCVTLFATGLWGNCGHAIAQNLPAHAVIDIYGTDWTCVRGYFRQNNECVQVRGPANSVLDVYGSGWTCARGFYQQGNECIQVGVVKSPQVIRNSGPIKEASVAPTSNLANVSAWPKPGKPP